MFKASIQTVNGAQKRTWVYIVDGGKLQPLLRKKDAEDLGIIRFHPEGKEETANSKVTG